MRRGGDEAMSIASSPPRIKTGGTFQPRCTSAIPSELVGHGCCSYRLGMPRPYWLRTTGYVVLTLASEVVAGFQELRRRFQLYHRAAAPTAAAARSNQVVIEFPSFRVMLQVLRTVMRELCRRMVIACGLVGFVRLTDWASSYGTRRALRGCVGNYRMRCLWCLLSIGAILTMTIVPFGYMSCCFGASEWVRYFDDRVMVR